MSIKHRGSIDIFEVGKKPLVWPWVVIGLLFGAWYFS